MTTSYRGKRVFDGAWNTYLACPPGVACLRVSCFPANVTYAGIVLGILTTPPEEMVKAVAKMTGINPVKLVKQVMTAPAEQRTQLLGMVKGMVTKYTGLPDADIYPGKYSPLPNGFADWIAQVFAPGDSKQLDLLYETGVKDGTSWAVEQGLIPPFIKDAVRTPFVDVIAARNLAKM
jgi:hypothetical protein